MKGDLLVGVFERPEALLAAARAARSGGYPVSDVYTPFPVHGMDEALGLSPSRLPSACLAFAMTGLGLALGFEYWVSLFDWPMNIGGKPFHASPALLPIAFELTVLFGGLGTVATFLALRRLHPGRRPRLAGLGATDDKFLLALKLPEEGGGRLRGFLTEHGASAVEELRGER